MCKVKKELNTSSLQEEKTKQIKLYQFLSNEMTTYSSFLLIDFVSRSKLGLSSCSVVSLMFKGKYCCSCLPCCLRGEKVMHIHYWKSVESFSDFFQE